MIVEVSIRHAAETKVRGRTKTRHYDAVVPLHVREASGDDAPRAAWWPRPRNRNRDPATVCLRSFQEKVWQPVMEGDTFPFTGLSSGRYETVGTDDGLARDEESSFARQGRRKASMMTAGGLGGFLRGAMGGHDGSNRLDDYAGTVLEEDRLVKEVVSSELPSLVARMQAMSVDWAVIDGVAHRRIPHPMYEFEVEGSYPTIRTTTADDCDDPGTAYPILRHQEAFAAFRKASPGRASADMVRTLRPTILEPSLLSFDTAAWLGRTLAGRVVDGLSTNVNSFGSQGSRVSYLSRDGMAAFAALRDMDPAATPREMLDLLAGFDGSGESVTGALDARRGCKGVMDRMRSEVAAVEAELEAMSAMPGF